MKRIIALCLSLLLLCLASCRVELEQNPKTVSGQDTAVYADILDDYKKLVAFYLSDSFKEDWNKGNIPQWSESLKKALVKADSEYAFRWSSMIGTMGYPLTNLQPDSFGYILLDINSDDLPELFWVREDHRILAVFTVVNNKVTLLDAFWYWYSCVVIEDNRLYTCGSSSANKGTVYKIQELSDDGDLTTVLSFGVEPCDCDAGVSYFEIVDGKRTVIDEARFDALFAEYPFEASEAWLAEPIMQLE